MLKSVLSCCGVRAPLMYDKLMRLASLAPGLTTECKQPRARVNKEIVGSRHRLHSCL